MVKPLNRRRAALLVLVAGSSAGAQECYLSTYPAGTYPRVFNEPLAVYDQPRARILVVDFSLVAQPRVYAWTQSSATGWLSMSLNGPTPRTLPAAAFDQLRGVIVVYGGISANGFPAEVWEWSQNGWSTIPAPPGFRGRARHAMVYDEARGRTVMFGGTVDGVGVSNDTWLWDGTTWTEAVTPVRPSPRNDAAMVYDPSRQRVILFTGVAGAGGSVSDTWEWDGSAWSQRSPFGPWQSPRSYAFNAATGRVFHLGSQSSDEIVYEFNSASGTWTHGPWIAPGSGAGIPAVFDVARGRVVLCGGSGLRIWNDSGSVAHPWITSSPQSATMFAGLGWGLFVGSGPVNPERTYQWFRNDVPLIDGGHISGAQESQLRFNPVSLADAGVYHALVSNACGAVTSDEAVITVATPCYTTGCYANCDFSTSCPALSANDFVCFLRAYNNGQSYADCDGIGGLTSSDFICFVTAYNSGCS
jgi:hypothetical protein